MNVFTAARQVREYLLSTISDNIVQTNGIIGICNGEILKI